MAGDKVDAIVYTYAFFLGVRKTKNPDIFMLDFATPQKFKNLTIDPADLLEPTASCICRAADLPTYAGLTANQPYDLALTVAARSNDYGSSNAWNLLEFHPPGTLLKPAEKYRNRATQTQNGKPPVVAVPAGHQG